MKPTKEREAEMKKLYSELCSRIWQGINSGDATSHLEWLGKQDTQLIRETIVFTQPNGWATLAGKLVESINDDQAAWTLAALVAVFVQAAEKKAIG